MKKLLAVTVLFALLAFGGLFAIAKLAPMDKIKEEAVRVVKQKTGRDLAFDHAEITVWPSIGITLQNASFSNAPWAAAKEMVTLKGLDIRLAVMPLLQKRVEVSKIVLVDPVISLETAADGKNNWDMQGTATTEAAIAKPAGTGAAMSGLTLAFSGLELKGGRLAYADRRSGVAQTLDDINISLAFKNLDSPASLKGAVVYRGKKIDLSATIEKPAELLKNKPSAAQISVATEDMTASIDGLVAQKGDYLKNGSIDARISSLSGLVAWAGGAERQPLAFEKVSLTAKARATATALTLNDAVLSLDDILTKGDVTLGYGGRPSVKAVVSLDKIDLDRFIKTDGSADAAPAPVAAAEGGWDTTPLDLSGLKAVDADIKATVQGFSLKGAEVGPSTLTVLLKDGVLKASSTEARLFGGAFSSSLGVNAASAVPQFSFAFGMKGVQAKPVLETFAGFKNLSGTVEADIDVTAAGNSQKAIIGALQGKGSAVFKDGALEGIDLLNIAKMVQKGLTDMGVGAGKTDFVSLGGTFTIAKGIISNADLAMKGPLLQASGKGTVDLPQKFLKYRVVPVLTASSAVDNAKGVKIPVDIVGPFDKLKIIPDIAGLAEGLLKNPEDAKAAVREVKDQVKQIKTNIKDLKADIKENPVQALDAIMGGGLGSAILKGKKAAEPAIGNSTTGKAAAPAPTKAPEPKAETVPAPVAEKPVAPVETPKTEVPVAEPVKAETPKVEVAPAPTPTPAPAPATPAAEPAPPAAETAQPAANTDTPAAPADTPAVSP